MSVIIGQLKSGTTGPAPEIECWIPSNASNAIGLIIFPGGGYGHLAEHEGKGYAEYLSNAGVACFVVKYRLGNQGFRHPAMLEDALAAIQTVRGNASEFGIDPNRIGVMGSSAGGHLAAHAMVAYGNYDSDVSLRPDFGVLCYPVISAMGDCAHKGSMKNLLGPDADPALLKSVSCDAMVSAETPPCFLWHTVEDAGVPMENSLLYAAELRKHDIPFELHFYQNGRHGLGLETEFDWGKDCVRWMQGITQAE
jgi:acetyl esterase/lipase